MYHHIRLLLSITSSTPGKSRNVLKLGTEGIVRLDGGRTSFRLLTNRSQKTGQPMDLARENQALHEHLREEAARYDRQLDTYKLAQQRQAVLVSRLQAKFGIFDFTALAPLVF